MKRFTCFLICASFLATNATFAQDEKKSVEIQVEGKKLEVSVSDRVSETPFYFPPGVVVENKNPRKQWAEYLRHIAATKKKFQDTSDGAAFVDADSIRVETDLVSTSHLNNKPVNAVLVFDNYVRLTEGEHAGKVRVTMFDNHYVITEEQFQVVKNDLYAQLKRAAEENWQWYGGLYEEIVTARAQALGIEREKFVQYLDQTVDGTTVTYSELNHIPPKWEMSDFVPSELHLGYTPSYRGVLGLTLLNTGIVYYNPQARILDYMVDSPATLKHEMIHVNSKLQNYPAMQAVDLELLAMMPEGLDEETQIFMTFHFYMEELRTICWIYYGFDFNEAKRRVLRFELAGNYRIDEEKFNSYMEKVRLMQAELQSFMKVVVREFYSKPDWYMAWNDKMQNDNAYVWLVFAQHYEPTVLEGHTDTMKWLLAHEQDIKDIGKTAWKKTGEEGEGGVVIVNSVPDVLKSRYKQMFTSEERAEIEKYFRDHPEALAGLGQAIDRGDLRGILSFLNDIKKPKRRMGVH